MFEDFYDAISFLWSWRWPVANGKVTEVLGEHVEFRSGEKRARLSVTYEFSVGSDGPYTGECFWSPIVFSIQRVAKARRKIHRNQAVAVRYRADDPSVNTLDRGVAKLLRPSRISGNAGPGQTWTQRQR